VSNDGGTKYDGPVIPTLRRSRAGGYGARRGSMGRRPAGEADAEWRARLESWDASVVSLRAFALREGLNPRTLWRWKKQVRGVATPATAFASVVLRGSSRTGACERPTPECARQDGIRREVTNRARNRLPVTGGFDRTDTFNRRKTPRRRASRRSGPRTHGLCSTLTAPRTPSTGCRPTADVQPELSG
jgi:hypothetical protein